MPEKKGYLWDPMYGILPDVDPIYYDDSLTEPAVVSAPLPAKFNGSREAARRYAEGYRWGRENVRDPREQVAPYVGAGLAATMLAPYAIGAAATGVTNPWAIQFGKRMLLDLPAFEVVDRLPTLIGQDRATVQAGNLAERGFRALSPDGRFEENVAPYVNQAGQFVGGFVPGMMGDATMRGGVSLVNRIGKSIASDRAGYFEPIAEMMQERPIGAVSNSARNGTMPRGTDFDVDATAFRYDQTGIETPIITGPGGNVTEARIPGDVRQRVLVDHPEMAEELAALQNNPAEMQRAMQEMAAMTPEQIAETQAILTDVAKGNRAVKETLLHDAPKPTVEAPLANGYSIERYPGYQLKMLMAGNPLEKQIGKNGTVNINNINALKQKASKVEQAVIDKVLASNEFAGQKAVDYNKFRKAVQDELITYERTPDTRWEDYGTGRLGFLRDIDTYRARQRMIDRFVGDHDDVEVYYGVGRNDDGTSAIFGQAEPEDLTMAEIIGRFQQYDPAWFSGRTIPGESANTIKTNTYTFSSPRIPYGSSKHYDANTLGHSRTYTAADEPDVLHVMESQSDWAQKKDYSKPSDTWEIESNKERNRLMIQYIKEHPGNADWVYYDSKGNIKLPYGPGSRLNLVNLEEDYPGITEYINKNLKPIPNRYIADDAMAERLHSDFTSRQIQENLRYAAEKGQKKMRYPTRETVAKIEGYQKSRGAILENSPEIQEKYNDFLAERQDAFNKIYSKYLPENDYIPDSTCRIEELPDEILDAMSDSEIKELRRKSALSWEFDKSDAHKQMVSEINELAKGKYNEQKWLEENVPETWLPKHETILKKYDAFPKQYQKLFKGADVRTVTDQKGNTWYEVDVPENYLQQEWAYKSGGLLSRLRSRYGSDDKVLEAVRKFKNGGDKATLNHPKYNAAKEKPMYDYLRYRGLGAPQASGMLGNLAVESWLNADLQQQGGGPAYGLMQAEASRQTAMKNYDGSVYQFGSNLSPEEQQQLDYIIDKGVDVYTPGEWGRKNFKGARDARAAFINADDVRTASDIVTNNFLRPGKPHIDRRRAMSEYYYDKYNSEAPYGEGFLWGNAPGFDFSAGGKIHIKPENRGKFTALKKRTGHSASWFKAHGTPAQKKMAVFALNARKWKHGEGGLIERYGADAVRAALVKMGKI